MNGSYCHGHPPASVHPNRQPLTQPQAEFVTAVPNGKLYQIKVDDQYIPIVHLYGTPYEKGFAHGQLMKDRSEIEHRIRESDREQAAVYFHTPDSLVVYSISLAFVLLSLLNS